jgi:hypothetical protein
MLVDCLIILKNLLFEELEFIGLDSNWRGEVIFSNIFMLFVDYFLVLFLQYLPYFWYYFYYFYQSDHNSILT